MNELNEPDVTRMLADFGSGDRSAMNALLPKVYDELRRLAATHFADERIGHTLQPTALVNEAYLRMADQSGLKVTSRGHFFRLASKVMRQILIDHARARHAAKRGGAGEQITLSDFTDGSSGPDVDILALEEALERLARFSPDQARLVELRFYGGLTIDETADALGISRTLAVEEWRAAKAWLADELAAGEVP